MGLPVLMGYGYSNISNQHESVPTRAQYPLNPLSQEAAQAVLNTERHHPYRKTSGNRLFNIKGIDIAGILTELNTNKMDRLI